MDEGTDRRASAERSAVDPQHPWLGLASFTEETRAYFYGREEEVAELARRVQRKLLTILFGQSGLGKTSILRAGIVPRLRPEGYCPVYVRLDYSPDTPEPSEQIKQAIFRATEASGTWTQPGVAVAGESLWEFLHHRDDVLRDTSGKTLIPLLIFDQFEEIFTLAQSDDFGRKRAAQFMEDLADLVENRAPKALEARMDTDEGVVERFDFTREDYRILIALREDYLAHLESVKAIMPSITQNRMRLARMTGEQALAAVLKPGGKLVSEEVAEAIVRFIAGGSELRNAEVEPSLLSLICRELNNARIAQSRSEISADLLAGSRDTILAEFYERAVGDQPPGVRKFIEDEMLTESGFRESLAEERVRKAFAAVGAPPDTLAKLVDRRLLRIEERLDVRRVELTHDVLCGVVKASRDLRLEREARDEAERKLAAQRERERATRKALVRARQIAAVCGVLAIGAVAGAIFGYVSTKRAQEAEAKAQQTQRLAETARGEAEKLVVFLLDDFYVELAPVGRLDIVAGLAKRAIDYYNALPKALRTPETERNRALALVRYGATLRTLARLDEARGAIDEAVKILSTKREQGDNSEATTIGLALGLSTQARLLSSFNRDAAALPLSERAVATIRPLATTPDASATSRRAFGEVLNMHGFLLMLNRNEEASLAALDEARTAYKSIANLELSDASAAAGYAEVTAWKVQDYANRGNIEDAIRTSKEALDVSGKVLEKRPGHMQALRAQALATSPLAVALRSDMRLADALAAIETAVRSWREFVRLDPGNTISWSNLGVGYFNKNFILEGMGRFTDGAAAARAGVALDPYAQPSVIFRTNLGGNAGRTAYFEAQLGNRKQAAEALAQSDQFFAWVIKQLPEGSYEQAIAPTYSRFWRTQVAWVLGDYRAAIESGREITSIFEPLEPPNDGARFDRARWMSQVYGWIADSAYALGDFEAAEKAALRSLELRKATPSLDLDPDERRETSNQQAIAALILERRGRHDEAVALINAALAHQRKLAVRNRDDQFQHVELANALFVAAAVGVGNRSAQLNEANALIDRLPPELKGARTVNVLRERIAEEKSRRRAE